MVSYVIQHFNRPYFLDLHIQLVRKYSSIPLQIIIADDGSPIPVRRRLASFGADTVFVQPQHRAGRFGSRSSTLSKSTSLAGHQFLVCSEDDFLPAPHFMPESNYSAEYCDIIYYKNQPVTCILKAAAELLSERQEIHVAQLARGVDYEYHHASSKQLSGVEVYCGGVRWRHLHRPAFEQYYFCNWPYMMRTEEFRRIKLGPGVGMVRMELRLGDRLDSLFTGQDYQVIPDFPRYVHCGAGMSQQTYNTKRMTLFLSTFQKNMFGRIVYPGLHNFGNRLSELWAKGQFSLDVDELLASGYISAMQSALHRAKNYL